MITGKELEKLVEGSMTWNSHIWYEVAKVYIWNNRDECFPSSREIQTRDEAEDVHVTLSMLLCAEFYGDHTAESLNY